MDPVSVLVTIQILKTSQENINHSWGVGVALHFDYFHLLAYAVESDNINHSSSFLFYFMFFNFFLTKNSFSWYGHSNPTFCDDNK